MRSHLVLILFTIACTAPTTQVLMAQTPNPPVGQPDIAPTKLFSPHPPAPEQPTSGVTLTLQDLPPGFQEVPPQIKKQLVTWLEPFRQLLAKGNLPLDNFFAFANLQKFEVVFGFSRVLPNQPLALSIFDATLQQLQQTAAQQQLIDQLRERGRTIPGIELIEYAALPELSNLANASTGLTLAAKLQGRPIRIELAGFRRNTIGAFTAVFYVDGTQPVVSLKDVVSKLDNRILQLSPATVSRSVKNCNCR